MKQISNGMLRGAVFILLAGFALQAAAAGAWSNKTGMRTRTQATLADGSVVYISTIDRSPGTNLKTGAVRLDMTILVQAGGRGSWVVTRKRESDGGNQLRAQYTFRLLQTGETLGVDYQTISGDGGGTYCVNFRGETKTVLEQNTLGPGRGLPAFVGDNTSDMFQKGLALLEQLARTVPRSGLPVRPFEALGVMGGVITPGERPKVEHLRVNCRADAEMGFPCEPGEHPAGKGKFLYLKDLGKAASR
ncbi:MAG: hypothetical protein P8018_13135 [Acidobacteriota bacterium]